MSTDEPITFLTPCGMLHTFDATGEGGYRYRTDDNTHPLRTDQSSGMSRTLVSAQFARIAIAKFARCNVEDVTQVGTGDH